MSSKQTLYSLSFCCWHGSIGSFQLFWHLDHLSIFVKHNFYVHTHCIIISSKTWLWHMDGHCLCKLIISIFWFLKVIRRILLFQKFTFKSRLLLQSFWLVKPTETCSTSQPFYPMILATRRCTWLPVSGLTKNRPSLQRHFTFDHVDCLQVLHEYNILSK